MPQPFWKNKDLSEMSRDEWESLCDGCGKCCLHKLEDEDSQQLHYTNVACYLLDLRSCRCSRYPERNRWVPDCVHLTPDNIDELYWMPSTCAYRLLAEGKDLPAWHPLVSNSPDSVHNAGVSVRSWALLETQVDDVEEHIIDWTP